MDAQEEYDQTRVKLMKKGLKGSKSRLEALLKKKAKEAYPLGTTPLPRR